MENFSEDVLMNIFPRLQAQTILKFRRVCKLWRTLLTEHYFVYNHIQRQLDHNNDENQSLSKTSSSFLCLIKSSADKQSISQLYHLEFVNKQNIIESSCNLKLRKLINHTPLNIPGSSCNLKLQKLINHPPLYRNQNLVGSCNGLVCFSGYYDKRPTYICNTITKEFINVPRSIFSRRYSFCRGTCGFGYIPSTGEYKIVHICYAPYGMTIDSSGYVYVFTLGGASNSKGKWKPKTKINCSFINPNSSSASGIFLNGSLHWFDSKRGKVVSFDLVDERFRSIHSEPFTEIGPCTNLKLRVLGRSLCLVRNNMMSTTLDIWLLKKNNRNDLNFKEDKYKSWSWIKEYSIGFANTIEVGNCEILSIVGSRGLILGSSSRHLFYWCDLQNKTFEELHSSVGFDGTNSGIWDVIPHVNSFVSLKDIGEEGEVINIKQTRSRMPRS